MTRALLWSLCAAAYLYVFPYQATLNNPNENVRFYMTAALAEQATYAIDGPRQRWGWVNDAAVRGGHVYSVKAPGTSLLGVPGYFAYLHVSRLCGHPFDRTEALWVCRASATILPTLLFAWFFLGFLLRHHPPELASATFVAVMLGSLLYGYGMLFVSHTLSAVAAFSAFMWLYEVERGERFATPLSAAGAGLAAAATTWFEYPGLVVSVVLTGYAAWVLRRDSWKLRAAYLAGAALPALSLMHFQWSAFGNPFTPGHLFVESEGFRAAHEQGLYGAVGVSWTALHGLLFDRGAGLFPLTPLLWLAIPGFVLMALRRETRSAAISCSSVCVLSTLAIASLNNWRGGWTIGPRYLAMCVPFFAFAALHTLDWLSRRAPLWAAGLAVGSCAAACIASGLPSAYYPHLPPEFTRPLPQLIAVLMAHDFAPHNLGNVLGLWGTASLVPLFALVAAAVVVALLAARLPARRLAAVGGGALLVASLALAPLWIRPAEEPGVRQAVAFVTSRFSPPDHDRAASLHAQLKAAGRQAPPEDWQKLRELYLEEGRDPDARRAAARR